MPFPNISEPQGWRAQLWWIGLSPEAWSQTAILPMAPGVPAFPRAAAPSPPRGLALLPCQEKSSCYTGEEKQSGSSKDLASAPRWGLVCWSPSMPLHTGVLVPDVQLSACVCLGSHRVAGKWELTGSLLDLNNIIPQAKVGDAFVRGEKHWRAVRLCPVPASSLLCNCSSISNSKIMCFHKEI